MEEFQVRNPRRLSSASDTTLIDYNIEGLVENEETTSFEGMGNLLSVIESENTNPPKTNLGRRAPPNLIPSKYIYTIANRSAKRESKKPKITHFSLAASPRSTSSQSPVPTMEADPEDTFNPLDITYRPTVKIAKSLFKSASDMACERHAALERMKVLRGLLEKEQDRREILRFNLEGSDLERAVDFLESRIFALSSEGKAEFMAKFRELRGEENMQVIEGIEVNEPELKREAERKRERKVKYVY